MKIEIAFDSRADRRVRMERQALNLTKACPVDGTNPVHCPLCDLRLLPVRERKRWVQSLTMEELEYLLQYHNTCYALKTVGFQRPRKVLLPA